MTTSFDGALYNAPGECGEFSRYFSIREIDKSPDYEYAGEGIAYFFCYAHEHVCMLFIFCQEPIAPYQKTDDTSMKTHSPFSNEKNIQRILYELWEGIDKHIGQSCSE